ncbi:hypothetical protein SERLADRAFT_406123 [Serpula lacrymans var. lacrymans S7.9]|uniref:Uncharacterized protein n=1 Tax=Serpula lacrymans var. lacrymans (strain S7.9) TaxID=578457 RepID=F8NJS3_SERL9|nr:uncharacterized protein SERLADRAFT_406123 [Serpula lacrymans var. lacrymans S7.9]EGO28659.1 hypothetical protein SERLADRAFT_406123 [Serpula lacrymans var. lacrymans S7.9]
MSPLLLVEQIWDSDVFQSISDVMEFCLPEEYSMLAKIVDMLPGKPGSPVTPFLSLVVNTNVLEGIEGTQAISARRNATAATALSKEDENLLGALLARKKAALASEAEAEKSATRKRVAAMLADEEDSERDDLHGKKICLNGDDNDNNDNEDVADDDDNADDGKNMIDHILVPAEIFSDDQDNSVVPPLQPLSDDNEEKEEEQKEDNNNEVVRGTDSTAAENDSGLVDKMKERYKTIRSSSLNYYNICGKVLHSIKNIHKDKLSDMIHWIINSEAFINNTIDLKHKGGVPKVKVESMVEKITHIYTISLLWL